LVPAKLEGFNDKGCLAAVDQVLEQAVASGKSRHTFQVAAELHKVKEKTGGGGQSVSAENLPASSDKGEVVAQAVFAKRSVTWTSANLVAWHAQGCRNPRSKEHPLKRQASVGS